MPLDDSARWTLHEVLRELGEVAATADLDVHNKERVNRCQRRLKALRRN
jgi:hypothetical protein